MCVHSTLTERLMSQREEFSFVFEGQRITFVKMYNDCWISSLPWMLAEQLKRRISKGSDVSVNELILTTRARNVLIAQEINTIYDLIQNSEEDLLKLVNCGETTVIDIKLALQDFGLELRK